MEGMVKVKINDIKDSENILKTILEQKGFSEDKPDVEKAVSAFMEFSNYKFECETDEMLWETGTFNFTGEKLYHFCLVRQFQLEDEDEFWQLHLKLMYDEEPKIANTYECLWESEGEFFDKILNSEAYKSLIGRDCKCNIYLDET